MGGMQKYLIGIYHEGTISLLIPDHLIRFTDWKKYKYLIHLYKESMLNYGYYITLYSEKFQNGLPIGGITLEDDLAQASPDTIMGTIREELMIYFKEIARLNTALDESIFVSLPTNSLNLEL